MPIPMTVAKINRYVGNPFVRRFAGRIPPFALMEHQGRRSGKRYRTPIMAFPAGDGFIVALTYGPDTDWERNVRAGGGELIYRGQRHRIDHVRLVGGDIAGRHLPGWVLVILRRLGVHNFLHLETS